MRAVVTAGTDVAAICAGDPSLLAELRAHRGRKYQERLSETLKNGIMWVANTGADGGYLVHVYVDEDPPEEVRRFLVELQVIEDFPVPSGKLWVAGQEVFVGAIAMEKHAHMGQQVEIAPGHYQLTAFLGEYEEEHAARFARQATADQRRASSRGSRLLGASLFTSVAAATITIIGTRVLPVWLAVLLGLASVALWAELWRHTRSPAYQSGRSLQTAIASDLPSIVLHLKRKG